MRILILNWRCPSNPDAGGAELLTHELARRLVAAGNTVEWFSAAFPGSSSDEVVDGVHFVRAGRQWSVHVKAYQRYRGRLRGRFDCVIDEVNTIPFFAPLWADVPTVMLIYQLARDVWWYESPFPINALGFAVEPLYLRCYRRVPVFTISKSTEQDLRRLGFRGSITVMPVGIEPITDRSIAKEPTPTFLYVGRLAPSKRISHIVQAFFHFRDKEGTGKLWLLGEGSPRYRRSLMQLTGRLGLGDSVSFLGRASGPEKHRRMSQAHALLMTSVREGWGLAVTEANACGTPAIVYDVPGLRDSVVNNETGLVVNPRPKALAEAMRRLLQDDPLRQHLSSGAVAWATRFSLDDAAATFQRGIYGTQADGIGPVRAVPNGANPG